MNAAEVYELVASVLLFISGTLALLGAVGLTRLRTFYERMHPPALITTMGLGCALLASLVVNWGLLDRLSLREPLIWLLMVLTTPITALVLMRAARTRQR